MKLNILEMHEGKFSSEGLEAVFNKIKDEAHWKNPIDVLVEEHWLDITQAAIAHYHGTIASVEFEEKIEGRKWFRVNSDGYACDPTS